MWPFMAAASVTFYLVSKGQEAGVRCKHAATPLVRESCLKFLFTADEYKNDPKNPYAQQVAKEAAHH